MCTGAQEGILAQQLAGELGENFDLILRADSAAAKQASEKVGAVRQKHMQLSLERLGSQRVDQD